MTKRLSQDSGDQDMGDILDRMTIVVETPIVSSNLQCARLSTVVRYAGNEDVLWYEIEAEYSEWFSHDRMDGFVVAILLQAMRLGTNIVAEGPMSLRLLRNLTTYFIPMMAKAFPELHLIEVLPATTIADPTGASGVASGFSGGVDSFSAIVDHLESEAEEAYRIDHLLFFNVGSHGDQDFKKARDLFRERYDLLKQFPASRGVPFVAIDTNVHEIFPLVFEKNYITLNASVPLVLQGYFGRYFYASSYKYEDCGVGRTDVIGRFDPIAFHLLSTESLDCVSTGGQMSRVEKTMQISSYAPSREFLSVCVDPSSKGMNCSICLKCCRTLLTLELLGAIDAYSSSFNIGKFESARPRYIRRHVLTAKRGDFEFEILDLACRASTEMWVKRVRFKRGCHAMVKRALAFSSAWIVPVLKFVRSHFAALKRRGARQ